ncbi:hypothetical protein ACS0TY_013104 [Phlomoides rotata]
MGLIRNAAHLMVAKLAGSLAHVTCKSFSGVSAEMRLPWQRHIRLLRACMKMHQTVLLLMLTL